MGEPADATPIRGPVERIVRAIDRLRPPLRRRLTTDTLSSQDEAAAQVGVIVDPLPYGPP